MEGLKTREEILEENGAHLHDEAYQYSCDTEDLRVAMAEYAKQLSIYFAKHCIEIGEQPGVSLEYLYDEFINTLTPKP